MSAHDGARLKLSACLAIEPVSVWVICSVSAVCAYSKETKRTFSLVNMSVDAQEDSVWPAEPDLGVWHDLAWQPHPH